MNLRNLVRGFLVLGFILGLSACTSKPGVIIISPPSGSVFNDGDAVKVQSVATDSAGITRVELIVDSEIVKIDPSPTAQGQPNFSLIQIWKATSGAHTITVRAYNAAGAVSDPVAVAVNVAQVAAPEVPTNVAVLPNATLTPVAAPPRPSPTPTTAPNPSPTLGTASPTESVCADNSVYIADVTVPDGTNFNAGQSFTKTWRISNNGSCGWDNGYQFVFVKGEGMATTTVIPVPKTAVGASIDLSVPMIAPATPGSHTGQWKLRNANGSLFGQSVTVKINVINPAPPPATGCVGTPSIASFTTSPTSITSGGTATLNWGLVSNADAVEIDNGIGGQATPGSVQVSPGSETTYTLTAHCGANTSSSQVTIAVTPKAVTTPLVIVTIPPLQLNPKVTSVAVIGGSSARGLPAKCPKQYTFTGTITANKALTASYKWERDDGDGPSGSISFAAAGSKDVFYTVTATILDTYGTVQLHVTAPNSIKSTTATYSCSK